MEAEHAATLWYHSSETWIAISFSLFVILAIKYIVPLIGKGLDSRAASIRDQLEQASRLRAEAAALLATYQREHEEKVRQAEKIVEQARIDAQTMHTQAEADLKAAVDRRIKQAEEKIARAEADATQIIRARMIDIATQAARDIIESQIQSGNDPAISKALAAIEQQIH